MKWSVGKENYAVTHLTFISIEFNKLAVRKSRWLLWIHIKVTCCNSKLSSNFSLLQSQFTTDFTTGSNRKALLSFIGFELNLFFKFPNWASPTVLVSGLAALLRQHCVNPPSRTTLRSITVNSGLRTTYWIKEMTLFILCLCLGIKKIIWTLSHENLALTKHCIYTAS